MEWDECDHKHNQLRQGEGPAEEHRPLAGEGATFATSISSKLIPAMEVSYAMGYPTSCMVYLVYFMENPI